MNPGHNTYTPVDRPDALPPGAVVFISHRSTDKPIARVIATLLSSLEVSYWLDEEDRDLRNAASLGMNGDSALVHAIERGIRHSNNLLGLLSPRTIGSWWVPYEIGYSRSQQATCSFLAIQPSAAKLDVPEYARITPVYWSVDELARWAATLASHDLHSGLTSISHEVVTELSTYLPFKPPEPDIPGLCVRALESIHLLQNPLMQAQIALRSKQFAWMPSVGALIKELAYDLLAPLACYQLGKANNSEQRACLEVCYRAITEHVEIARQPPPIAYDPEVSGWKQCRYETPSSTWLQGLRQDQLAERLDRFLCTRAVDGELRLTTRAEFKAEYDRVSASDERDQRALGVLLNPLFGFTPDDRPVFQRILSIQALQYSKLLRTIR